MIELGLSLVKVGDRRREDYGDINALAASIAEHGLLHPIVVDADDNLVAGGRRLRAVEQLGWFSIPVTRLGDLTETQLREVELEENLRRKDLTQEERDRNLVALIETVKETLPSGGIVSNGSRGPAPDPSSDKQAAERIGVPRATVQAARDHVEAIDRYPEVRGAVAIGASRKDVVTIAKNLDALPDNERPAMLAKIAAKDVDTIGDLAEKPPMPPAGIGDEPSAAVVFHKLMQKIAVLVGGINRAGGLDRLTEEWTDAEREGFSGEADNAIAVLTEIRDGLKKEILHAA